MRNEGFRINYTFLFEPRDILLSVFYLQFATAADETISSIIIILPGLYICYYLYSTTFRAQSNFLKCSSSFPHVRVRPWQLNVITSLPASNLRYNLHCNLSLRDNGCSKDDAFRTTMDKNNACLSCTKSSQIASA